jgi:hypothetical protein
VRAKAFKKPHSLSHGKCDSNVGTKSDVRVDASCSKSQGTSHLQENDDLFTRTVGFVPLPSLWEGWHQESFFYNRARRMWRGGASRPFVVRNPSHGMNTCEPKKARFVDGFYDTLSSELGHAHVHASSVSCVGPRHASCGACVGSSPMTSKDFFLFVCVSTRISLRVALLRHGSKSVRKPFHSNQHFHHANPHDKLSASLTRVTKYWIPMYVLANPLGSKARPFSSPCV